MLRDAFAAQTNIRFEEPLRFQYSRMRALFTLMLSQLKTADHDAKKGSSVWDLAIVGRNRAQSTQARGALEKRGNRAQRSEGGQAFLFQSDARRLRSDLPDFQQSEIYLPQKLELIFTQDGKVGGGKTEIIWNRREFWAVSPASGWSGQTSSWAGKLSSPEQKRWN